MSLTIVFFGRRAALEKAKQQLEKQGIGCRVSRPRRDEGSLRVEAVNAECARRLLATQPDGRVVSANEAAWFSCPVCGATLSGGEKTCPGCHTFIGDPHGG